MQRRMPTWAWTLLGVVAVVVAALLAPVIAAEQPFAPAPTPSAEEAGAGADSGAAADHTAAASSRSPPARGGISEGIRAASIAAHEPGGPTMSTPCPPAAATWSARFAAPWPGFINLDL